MGKNRDPKKTPSSISSDSNIHQTRHEKQEIISAQYSGPLPLPTLLRDYGDIDPSFPERIMKMAELEQCHRHEIEKSISSANIEMARKEFMERRLGQIFALIIGLVVISCGTYCILNGHPVAGGIVGSGGVVGLVSAFIYGRKTENDKPPKQ